MRERIILAGMPPRKPVTVSLGQFIEARRKGLSLSQEQLGRKIRKSQNYISRVESGSIAFPGARVLGELAAALDVSVVALLDALPSDQEASLRLTPAERREFDAAIREMSTEQLRALYEQIRAQGTAARDAASQLESLHTNTQKRARKR